MATSKTQWNRLPAGLQQEIKARTGPIRRVEAVQHGENSELSLIVHHGDSDATFLKGLCVDSPKRRGQDRERTINPYISHLSAQLRWSLTRYGWDLSAFEHLKGRAANYSPGSPDVALVVDLLHELSAISCPEIPIKQAENRWSSYTDRPELFAGDHVAHTEWAPGNVLVCERARLIDWAWPTRAAGWIDSACWVVWLVAAGHSPHQAEHWAAQVPSWHTAAPSALNEFARVQHLLWSEITRSNRTSWTRELASAADEWSIYRRTRHP